MRLILSCVLESNSWNIIWHSLISVYHFILFVCSSHINHQKWNYRWIVLLDVYNENNILFFVIFFFFCFCLFCLFCWLFESADVVYDVQIHLCVRSCFTQSASIFMFLLFWRSAYVSKIFSHLGCFLELYHYVYRCCVWCINNNTPQCNIWLW